MHLQCFLDVTFCVLSFLGLVRLLNARGPVSSSGPATTVTAANMIIEDNVEVSIAEPATN